jgi:hypothetical protein
MDVDVFKPERREQGILGKLVGLHRVDSEIGKDCDLG